MTWQQLLASRSVAAHTTSIREMNSFRAMVARDLEDAALAELSADRSFCIAYAAVLILAKMLIAASGYRPLKTWTQQIGNTVVGDDGLEPPTPCV